jgi:transcription initiation factor TFIIB
MQRPTVDNNGYQLRGNHLQQMRCNSFRQGSNEEHKDRSRTGIPSSLAIYDMGLATVIGRDDRDATGKKLDAAMHSSMQRLRTWDSRAHASRSDKTLIQALSELQTLKDKLTLPHMVVEKAAYIYRKVNDRKLARGRAVSGLIAASVYIACREMSTPRTLNDIATASNVRRKQLAKAYRFLVIELDIKVPLADQTKCIAKVANKANLREKTKRLGIRIMDEIKRRDDGDGDALLYSAGKNPMSLAATILYLSCLKTGENKTQLEMAEAAGVTEVTIRNRTKELKIQLERELSNPIQLL